MWRRWDIEDIKGLRTTLPLVSWGVGSSKQEVVFRGIIVGGAQKSQQQRYAEVELQIIDGVTRILI